jgi:hypothetical protein
VNLTAIKTAISAWVVAASGVDAELVVWTQKMIGLRLPPPYFTLHLAALRQIGQPQQQTVTLDPEPDPPEYPLEVQVENSYELTFTIQAWGGEDPTSLLLTVQAGAALPSIRRALREAGVGLGELEQVEEHGGVQGANDLGPRASMDCTAFVRGLVIEELPAIETVRITDNVITPPETFDVTVGS